MRIILDKFKLNINFAVWAKVSWVEIFYESSEVNLRKIFKNVDTILIITRCLSLKS